MTYSYSSGGKNFAGMKEGPFLAAVASQERPRAILKHLYINDLTIACRRDENKVGQNPRPLSLPELSYRYDTIDSTKPRTLHTRLFAMIMSTWARLSRKK